MMEWRNNAGKITNYKIQITNKLQFQNYKLQIKVRPSGILFTPAAKRGKLERGKLGLKDYHDYFKYLKKIVVIL